MTGHGPEHIGPRPLAGYIMRDYDHAIVVLQNSRQAQRRSRTEVAERIGVYRQTLGGWEAGLHLPEAPNLFDLAHALGYDWALIPRETPAPTATTGLAGCGWCTAEGYACPVHADEALIRREDA